MIDRTDIFRKLAKALAFAACDKHAEAADWAMELLSALDRAGVINVHTAMDGRKVVERPARAIREVV